MINLTSVKKHYGNFQLDCTMHIPPGKITGLIGRNGSGKSTIFKAILNLINVEDGTIEVLPRGGYENSTAKKQDIGVALNYSGFSEILTIKQIANILSTIYIRFNKANFLEQCNSSNLPLNRKLKTFSTGMKTKLKILVATSYDAKVLLLDEPTTGLDIVARDEILHMLRTFMLSGEKSILIASHIATDLESICDQIYMIDDGKIIFHEDMDSILDQYGILKLNDEQFRNLDKEYLMKINREDYGYICLTKEKQFYMENYKDIVIERCSINMLMHMLVGNYMPVSNISDMINSDDNINPSDSLKTIDKPSQKGEHH